MLNIAQELKAYVESHPVDFGSSDSETVLDRLYQAYAESNETDPSEIKESFNELDKLLESLSLENNNAVFILVLSLCTAYEHKAFLDGLQYGAHLILELHK